MISSKARLGDSEAGLLLSLQSPYTAVRGVAAYSFQTVKKTIVLSLRDPAGVVAAQPLAALPPYGCGVPLAGAISQNNFASCMFSGEYEIFLIREALNESARAVSERFCHELRFENRRNTLCISRFSNRKVGTKDPLSAAADLFRASLDCHVAALLAMTRRGLFRHADLMLSHQVFFWQY